MASNYIQDHNRLFEDLTAALSRDLARLSSEANGGRSILFVYPPENEENYIEKAKKHYTGGYEFIDLRELFTEFVDSKGLDRFKRQFKNMGAEVFVSQNYSEGTFYSHLMKRVVEVSSKGVSPVLVHTDPAPKPQPTPNPQPGPNPQPAPQPNPTERKLRSQLPTGQLSVAQYKQWLKQQLAMVNQYGSTDILKFDE